MLDTELSCVVVPNCVCVDSGHLRGERVGFEIRLFFETVNLCADDGRKTSARRVVVLHSSVVIIARSIDAVLRPFNRIHELLETFGGAQLRIVLREREQSADSSAEAVVGINYSLLLLRRLVAVVAFRRFADRIQQTRARSGDVAEDLLFLNCSGASSLEEIVC